MNGKERSGRLETVLNGCIAEIEEVQSQIVNIYIPLSVLKKRYFLKIIRVLEVIEFNESVVMKEGVWKAEEICGTCVFDGMRIPLFDFRRKHDTMSDLEAAGANIAIVDLTVEGVVIKGGIVFTNVSEIVNSL